LDFRPLDYQYYLTPPSRDIIIIIIIIIIQRSNKAPADSGDHSRARVCVKLKREIYCASSSVIKLSCIKIDAV